MKEVLDIGIPLGASKVVAASAPRRCLIHSIMDKDGFRDTLTIDGVSFDAFVIGHDCKLRQTVLVNPVTDMMKMS